jgi:hypothetical protein
LRSEVEPEQAEKPAKYDASQQQSVNRVVMNTRDLFDVQSGVLDEPPQFVVSQWCAMRGVAKIRRGVKRVGRAEDEPTARLEQRGERGKPGGNRFDW